jgi:cytosine/adenosine deaminase-related metal-dependent hydrolase
MASAAGIAPVSEMVQAGVQVGLGVDGSAYNDTSHMLHEARQAMLLQRVRGDPTAMTARQALELATRGGAAVLGRDDIGALEPGKAADLIAINIDRLPFAGAHDPVAATLFCDTAGVDLSIINGRIVVQDGRLVTVDLAPVIARHNRLSRELMAG